MPYTLHPDTSRTKVQSAVDFLSAMPGFECFGIARFETVPTRLPDFTTLTLVALWGPIDNNGNGHVVGMASAKSFTARRAIESGRPECFPISDLDGAVVDEYANVTLCDGRHVYDVRLVQQIIDETFQPSEFEALRYCLAIHEDALERPVVNSFRELDERLAGFSPRSLKQIMGFIEDMRARNSSEPSVSVETVRTALRKMGIRRPKHGAYS